MTIRERAIEAVRQIYDLNDLAYLELADKPANDEPWPEDIEPVEQAIKAAIEEEREACAKTAESRAAMNKGDDREARMERAACHQIAALIRQGNPEQNIPLGPGRIWGITELPRSPGETVHFESKGD